MPVHPVFKNPNTYHDWAEMQNVTKIVLQQRETNTTPMSLKNLEQLHEGLTSRLIISEQGRLFIELLQDVF